ncbi:hypothetical protein ACWEOG_05300 [Amycolatopsis japonica]
MLLTLSALSTLPLRQAPTSVLDAVNGFATKNAIRATTPKMPKRMTGFSHVLFFCGTICSTAGAGKFSTVVPPVG